MSKGVRLFFMTATIVLAFTACKSKQKIASIPGGNIPATTETTTTTVPQTDPNAGVEVTRNESFKLSDGDADLLKFKYHVVVGSFKSQTNAKGLQTTLVNEGNKAFVVVNEQGMYRVLVASYNVYSEARTKINQIKDRFADAWVLVQK
ncbi:MAG TPA: SPOR domain-containing protein [Paludibacter sp.]|nr:SPOR domain-containing protein [Paludibacter sp.]